MYNKKRASVLINLKVRIFRNSQDQVLVLTREMVAFRAKFTHACSG